MLFRAREQMGKRTATAEALEMSRSRSGRGRNACFCDRYRPEERDNALNLEETPMKSDCHGVSSVVRIQFEKNVADMALHSIFTDIQPVSDNLVGAALGNELQTIDLSFGQGVFGSMLPQLSRHLRLHMT